MSAVFSTVWVLAGLTLYPTFGDVVPPSEGGQRARVEAAVDKGLMIELIVACAKGTTIVSFSKVAKLYCGPKKGCSRDFGAIVRSACGAD